MIEIESPFPVNIGSGGRAGGGDNRGGEVLAAAGDDDQMPVIVDVQSVVQQHQDHPDYGQFSIDNIK